MQNLALIFDLRRLRVAFVSKWSSRSQI